MDIMELGAIGELVGGVERRSRYLARSGCADSAQPQITSEPMKVHIGGELIEQVTLMELEVDNVYGPVGTVSWLMRTLREEGNGEEATAGKGTVLICSTPGGLYPVPPRTEVRVEFHGLTTTCVANGP